MVSKRLSFQLQFHFWKQEEVTGCQMSGLRWVVDNSQFVFRQKKYLARTEGCHGEVTRSVIAKVRGDVFARFHAVAAKLRSRIREFTVWDRCLALPQLLYRWQH
jgi:hypothetical protein